MMLSWPDTLVQSLQGSGNLGDVGCKLDHVLGDGLADEDEALHAAALLTKHEETLLALGSAGVKTTSNLGEEEE